MSDEMKISTTVGLLDGYDKVQAMYMGFANGAKGVPVISDPGGDGWPDEPKVTEAERMLYGDQAGVVRLLGMAATNAEDAYAVACRRAGEAFTEETEDECQKAARAAYMAYVAIRDTYRVVAAGAADIQRRWGEREGYTDESRVELTEQSLLEAVTNMRNEARADGRDQHFGSGLVLRVAPDLEERAMDVLGGDAAMPATGVSVHHDLAPGEWTLAPRLAATDLAA